jgi:hypothetical protein
MTARTSKGDNSKATANSNGRSLRDENKRQATANAKPATATAIAATSGLENWQIGK